MLELNFTEQGSVLTKTLDKMISGMLPHDKFDPAFSGMILDSILNYIKLEELRLEYYVFASLMIDYMEVRAVTKDFVPILGRDDLSNYLQAELHDLVTVKSVGMAEYCRHNGLKDDLENELNREEAANRLYEMVMDKYDELMELQVSGEEALTQIPILKSAVLGGAGYSSLRTQREVMDKGKWIDKRLYRGPEGWLNFIGVLHRDLTMRMEGKGKGVFTLKTTGQVAEKREKFRLLYRPFALTGWDPFDAYIGLVRHRFSVIVGNESIGKTAIAVSLTAFALVQGASVLYMYTEGTEDELLARIITSYIFFKYGKFVTTNHLAGKLPVDAKMDQLINLAMLEIAESGKLHLVESSTYTDLYTDLMNYHDQFGFDMGVIDHTAALKGKSGDMNKDTAMLATHVLEFKKARPVHIIATSHASYTAKELSNKGKEIKTSSNRGSATVSEAADDVIFLNADTEAEKAGLIGARVIKSRNGPKGASFELTMYSEVSGVRYEAAKQGLLGANVIEAREVVKEIVRTYSDDYDDDGQLDDVIYDELDTEILT